jgi:ACS family hexuronate transporter-like MFS transporter
MLIFAFIPLVALFAQPLGAKSVWLTAVIIGVACAAHQAWSANIFSVVGDMFPKRAIGTVVGIAQCAAGAGRFLGNKLAGAFISYSAGTALVDGREVEMTAQLLASGAKYAALPLQAFGYTGKSGAYMIIFCYCAVAYLIGWICMKILVPRYRQVEL